MSKIFSCRRSSLALIAIVCLTSLGFYHQTDISGIALAISGICAGVAASNSYEKSSTYRKGKDE